MRISDWSSDVCSSDLDRHPHQYVEERLVLRLAQNRFDDEIDAKRHGERRCYGCLFIAHGKVYPHADIDRVEDHSVKGDEPEDAVIQADRQIIAVDRERSEEHKSELQSLMRISYAAFFLKKKKK